MTAELQLARDAYKVIRANILIGDGSKKHPGLFKQQQKLVLDKSRRKFALCSRRAGKSVADAHYLILELLQCGFKEYVVFGAKTFAGAKRIIWADIVKLVQVNDFEKLLGWKINQGNCTIETPHGAGLIVLGFSDEGETGKLRGIKCKLVILDEVQEYEDLLEELIQGTISPLLFELQGTLVLTGTPGDALIGTWFDISTGRKKGWSGHTWTMLDNTFIPSVQELFITEIELLGLPVDDPFVQREYFGKWAANASKLIFPFYTVAPLPDDWKLDDPEWIRDFLNITFGIDYGFSPDPSAWIVLAQRRGSPTAYVIHAEMVERTNDDRYASITRDLYDHYEPSRMVGDVGGGGKGAIETFNEKFAHELGISIELAQKQQKRAFIDLMNIDLRTKKVVLAEGRCPELEQQLAKVRWKNDLRKEPAPGVPRHLCDALLYAWRAHFEGAEEEKKPIKLGYQPSSSRELQDYANEQRQRELDRMRNPDWDLYEDDWSAD